MFWPITFLVISNVFMTFAWYGHLQSLKSSPIWMVIFISWGIAFFEYCFQVPANRWGSAYFSLPQLKVMQEVITLVVFVAFSTLYMKIPITKNYGYAALCLIGAVYFVFRDVGTPT